jgi:hypothetical protein
MDSPAVRLPLTPLSEPTFRAVRQGFASAQRTGPLLAALVATKRDVDVAVALPISMDEAAGI